MTHQKIINAIPAHVKPISAKAADEVAKWLEELKSARELFSYKFPAHGPRHFNAASFARTIELCRLLGEVSQPNSECLEVSIKRNESGEYNVIPQVIEKCFFYQSKAKLIFEEDDY